MSKLKKVLLVLLLIVIVAQFFGPDKNEGNIASIKLFLEETNPPPFGKG